MDDGGEAVSEAMAQPRGFNTVGSLSLDADYEVTTEWSPTLSSAAGKLPPVSARGAPVSARDAASAAAAATAGTATALADVGSGVRSSAVGAVGAVAGGDAEGASDFVADIVAEGRARAAGAEAAIGPVPPPIDTALVRPL